MHRQSQAALASDQAQLLAIMDHADVVVASLRDVNALSPEENVKLHFWLTALMRSREFVWLQHRAGIIDEVQWSQELLILSRFVAGKVPRLWWETVGRESFAREFVAFVDEHLRDPAIGSENAGRLSSWSNA
jgi:hypothetical protein